MPGVRFRVTVNYVNIELFYLVIYTKKRINNQKNILISLKFVDLI